MREWKSMKKTLEREERRRPRQGMEKREGQEESREVLRQTREGKTST